MLHEKFVEQAQKLVDNARTSLQDDKGKSDTAISFECGYVLGLEKMLRFLQQYQDEKE